MSIFQAAGRRGVQAKDRDFMLISSLTAFLEASPNYIHLEKGYLLGSLETVALNMASICSQQFGGFVTRKEGENGCWISNSLCHIYLNLQYNACACVCMYL